MGCGYLHKSSTIVNKIRLRSFRTDGGEKELSVWIFSNADLNYVRFTFLLRIIHILVLFTIFTDS